MPRERLPIGGIGKIRVERLAPKKWKAIARIRDKDNVVRRIMATSTGAEKARNALKEKAVSRVPPAAGDIKLTTPLREVAEKWLEGVDAKVHTGDLKYGTYRQYRNTTRTHIVPLLGALTVRDITATRAQAFINTVSTIREQDEEEVGGKSAAKHALVCLRLIMKMVAQDDVIPHNPVDNVEPPRIETAPVRALTVDDVQDIRNTVIKWGNYRNPKGGRPRNAALLLDFIDVLAGTGCRPNEVLAFKWPDQDLRNNRTKITGTLVSTDEGLVRQSVPKTKASERGFTIPSFVTTVLRLRYMRAEDKEGAVFMTSAGTYYSLSHMHRMWRKARGEKWKHVSFKTYRKTVATMIERAEGIEAAAAQLGHSGPDITRRHYVEKEGMVDFAATMEALAPAG